MAVISLRGLVAAVALYVRAIFKEMCHRLHSGGYVVQPIRRIQGTILVSGVMVRLKDIITTADFNESTGLILSECVGDSFF